MRSYPFHIDGDNLHISEFPDAARFIQVKGDNSIKHTELILHLLDLQFSETCLDKIKKEPTSINDPEEIYWRTAVTFYIKCFRDSKARSRLDEKEIYKNEPPIALDIFNYFLNLRNKHFIHDENNYTQVFTGAILNKPDNKAKIAEIISPIFISSTYNSSNCANLNRLISVAIKYIDEQVDRIRELLKADLEKKDYDELVKMKSVTFKKPKLEDISKRRDVKYQ